MYVPKAGDKLPTYKLSVFKKIGAFILKATGWRFEGEIPNVSKMVMICAPHTSNWDALYGFAAVVAMGLKLSWMAKHSIFKWPIRRPLMALGGMPIERSGSHGLVDQIISEFEKRQQLILALTPEGTRKRVPRWKTGFYIIAEQAKVPIATSFIDYSNRTLGFGPLIEISGDLDADMEKLEKFYRSKKGKRVENFNTKIHFPE